MGEKLVWPFTQPWPPPLSAPLHWKVCWTLSSVQVICKWCESKWLHCLYLCLTPQRFPVSVWLKDSDIDYCVDDNISDDNGLALNTLHSLRRCTSLPHTHTHGWTSWHYTKTNKGLSSSCCYLVLIEFSALSAQWQQGIDPSILHCQLYSISPWYKLWHQNVIKLKELELD